MQSVPRLTFPGGALIGCAAGFVNLPRIKGSHNAMKTAMLAAEAAFAALGEARSHDELSAYEASWRTSWVYEDLYKVRNVKPGLHWGTLAGTVHGGVHMWLNDLGLGALVPWTLRHRRADHESFRPASAMPPIAYPRYDGDDHVRQAVVRLPVEHEPRGNQPVHLQLRDPAIPVDVESAPIYDGPEARYCPGGRLRIRRGGSGAGAGARRLQINAQNCVHCKTCDIKDPRQNIHWATPEGGGGPNYRGM